MLQKFTVNDYLASEETNRPQELAFGILREPPAPSFSHQVVVGHLFKRLSAHVERHALGVVATSPVDVVLDAARALIVQPDLLYVAAARRAICTDRVWGAPDLVVEVLSDGNNRHDRVTKVGWYREYGVRECWLVDLRASEITVIGLTAGGAARSYVEAERVRSEVLPRLRMTSESVFPSPPQ
ncbi:MAG: Uma2 family endonuclease [Vicinamibacterales bacterium]